MSAEYSRKLNGNGYVQKICRDFEKGGHSLFAKEKRLSLISNYEFDGLDSIPTNESAKKQRRHASNNNNNSNNGKNSRAMISIRSGCSSSGHSPVSRRANDKNGITKEPSKIIGSATTTKTLTTMSTSNKPVFRIRSFIHDTKNGTLRTSRSNEYYHGSEIANRKCEGECYKLRQAVDRNWTSATTDMYRKSYAVDDDYDEEDDDDDDDDINADDYDEDDDDVGTKIDVRKVSKDSSTDSGICHSSDMISTPKNELETFFHNSRNNEIRNESKNSHLKKKKKVDFYKTVIRVSNSSNDIDSISNKTAKWSSVVSLNDENDRLRTNYFVGHKNRNDGDNNNNNNNDNDDDNIIKRYSWSSDPRNSHWPIIKEDQKRFVKPSKNFEVNERSSSLLVTRPKKNDKTFINRGLVVRLETDDHCNKSANIVKLPKVSLKSIDLVKNMTNVSSVCDQLSNLNLIKNDSVAYCATAATTTAAAIAANGDEDDDCNDDDEIAADREVQQILQNYMEDPFLVPCLKKSLTPKKFCNNNNNEHNILNELSKAADEIFNIANEYEPNSLSELSSDDNQVSIRSQNQNDLCSIQQKPVTIRKKLWRNCNIRNRRLQIKYDREIMLSSSEDLSVNDVLSKIKKPHRKYRPKCSEDNFYK